MDGPDEPPTHSPELSLEQKRSFYRDGLITLKNIVPRELTFDARRRINKLAGRK